MPSGTDINNDIIKRIIDAGIRAPSGDNSQPWHFSVKDGIIYLFNLPDRDITLYNYKQRGSIFSHGALLENLSVAANYYGYNARISLFPDMKQSDLVASISFLPGGRDVSNVPLYDAIFARATNRRPFMKILLRDPDKKTILDSAINVLGCDLTLVEKAADKTALANAISINEVLLLENRLIHDRLFKQIRWTEKQERIRRNGLYAKTLELSPPKLLAFYLFKNWRLLTLFNKLGVSSFISREAAKQNDASSAIGLIYVPSIMNENFINAGRIFQRVWLTAVSRGLNLQPVTGVAYLAQRIEEGQVGKFSSYHVGLIRQAKDEIDKIIGIKGAKIAMIFRLGYSGSPHYFSSRLPALINWT